MSEFFIQWKPKFPNSGEDFEPGKQKPTEGASDTGEEMIGEKPAEQKGSRKNREDAELLENWMFKTTKGESEYGNAED